ncbi:MAG: apolipoprotein N-acyltransferase [Thermodesulfobacteriota bacterium]|nr:apolipoprotein N-acyltransferase [Thermodesulfobacteriota bacterium]
MNKKTLLLSLTSGLILFLSFPKADIGLLAWIALVPLLFAIKDTDLPGAFRAGFLAGLVYNTGLIYWVVFVVVHYGHLPFYAGASAMLLLAVYLSIYPALFCTGIVYFRRKGIRSVIVAPFLWTSLEYLKSHLFSGFPWENLAYSQHENLSIIQVADITGIYGITFLIVFLNCVVYDCFRGLFNSPGDKKQRLSTEIVIGFVLLLLVCGYGVYRIDHLKNTTKQFDPVDVLLVQGNIDQSIKWSPEYQSDTLNIYRDLSSDSSKRGASLIVWPETAVPFCFQNYNDKSRSIVDTARRTNSWLLFGSPGYKREGGKTSFYNSAYLLSPEGVISGRYDKVHLVPFGEYVPLHDILFFVDKLVEAAGEFTPGREIVPLPMGDRKLGVLICYEGIFPAISREYRLKGAELLVNITNDAWYGDTSAPYQHLIMAAFRSVENRVFMIRAANTGISAIVDSTGRIVSRTELFKRTALSGLVIFTGSNTFYTRYGDLFACFCIVFLLIGLLISVRRNNK